MDQDALNKDLMAFLKASPTPFHAVKEMQSRLDAAGFRSLEENDSWQLSAGKYSVTRNDSSIIAFVIGEDNPEESGLRMVGAHTDSPCLRVKPNPIISSQSYIQLGVEVYGGALLNPWYDRDLSLAGRVTFYGETGLNSCLINFEKPIAVIPSLAIHLDREANNQRSINPQKDIPPLLMQSDSSQDFSELLKNQIKKQYPNASVERILGHELCFYDVQDPALLGLEGDFIASARLDNLLSCYLGMTGLITSDGRVSSFLVCNDHEEVGSASTSGAHGTFLKSVLERLFDKADQRTRIQNRSLLISADNAHGIHPNYSDRHDGHHGPILNKGPVIKINANQRYATNSITEGIFRQICMASEIPCQSFVTRTDMACGSTIGPITATETGIPTVDVGLATFAMHSIREICGSKDPFLLHKALSAFFNTDGRLISPS